MFKVNNKDIRTTSVISFWCLYFTLFYSFSIFDFEQVNVSFIISKVLTQFLLTSVKKFSRGKYNQVNITSLLWVIHLVRTPIFRKTNISYDTHTYVLNE